MVPSNAVPLLVEAPTLAASDELDTGKGSKVVLRAAVGFKEEATASGFVEPSCAAPGITLELQDISGKGVVEAASPWPPALDFLLVVGLDARRGCALVVPAEPRGSRVLGIPSGDMVPPSAGLAKVVVGAVVEASSSSVLSLSPTSVGWNVGHVEEMEGPVGARVVAMVTWKPLGTTARVVVVTAPVEEAHVVVWLGGGQ